jgi:hypothetical protein
VRARRLHLGLRRLRDDGFLDTLEKEPFQAWTPDELLDMVDDKPLLYKPGRKWSYSFSEVRPLHVPKLPTSFEIPLTHHLKLSPIHMRL